MLWSCTATPPSSDAATSAAAESAASATITAETLGRQIADGSAPPVLDVRSAAEFAAGHVPGATNIPHDQLASRLSEVPARPDEELVVYCHSGRRAAMAEETLRKAGYGHLRDLQGHWSAWSAAGLPIQAP
jgi:phage shock protein E